MTVPPALASVAGTLAAAVLVVLVVLAPAPLSLAAVPALFASVLVVAECAAALTLGDAGACVLTPLRLCFAAPAEALSRSLRRDEVRSV